MGNDLQLFSLHSDPCRVDLTLKAERGFTRRGRYVRAKKIISAGRFCKLVMDEKPAPAAVPREEAPLQGRRDMQKIVAFLMLALLSGCSTHNPEPILRPQGNMPMTEKEYQEAEIFLLKEQKLPPDEYLRRRNEILSR